MASPHRVPRRCRLPGVLPAGLIPSVLLAIDSGPDPAAATDPAAFADILERAYQAQADALG